MRRRSSCSAKSAKSFVLNVASGRPSTRQQAAIQVSFTGRGRPRRWARACSSPQVVAIASSNGSSTTRRRQLARSASRRGPQFRSTVHFVSSPRVTNVMHNDAPASRDRSGSSNRPRKLVEATSVSRTTKLAPAQHAVRRRGPRGTRPVPRLTRRPRVGRGHRPTRPARPPCRRASSATGTCPASLHFGTRSAPSALRTTTPSQPAHCLTARTPLSHRSGRHSFTLAAVPGHLAAGEPAQPPTSADWRAWRSEEDCSDCSLRLRGGRRRMRVL